MTIIDIDSCTLPEINETQVVVALESLYGITGQIRKLDGERDLNYRVTLSADSGDQRYGMFKICNAMEQREMLECQHAVFAQLSGLPGVSCVRVIPSLSGKDIEQLTSGNGSRFYCRLTTWLEGTLLSDIKPQSHELLHSFGCVLANTSEGLQVCSQSALDRPILWAMDTVNEVVSSFSGLVEGDARQETLHHFGQLYRRVMAQCQQDLPRAVIHNDANDNNVIVNDTGPWQQTVKGLIDFGDMVYSWRVAELAVACAYVILNKEHPLDAAASVIAGFHSVTPIEPQELEVLYAMMAMRLCLSVSICARQKQLEPDNQYLSISERPAWQALNRLREISPDFAHYVFRSACGLSPIPGLERIREGLEKTPPGPLVDLDLRSANLLLLDTSVSSPHVSPEGTEFDPVQATRTLFRAIEDHNADAAIGRYDEYRLIYGGDDFVDTTGHQRTLHLGIDVFQPAGSPVYAPVAGTVHSVADNSARFDYGGTVILSHVVPVNDQESCAFYTLYGHLSPKSVSALKPGQVVSLGDQVGVMGDTHENGEWAPHVHFEIITDLLGQVGTFVGVGSYAHRDVWLSLCPDPNLLLGIPELFLQDPLSDRERDADVLHHRRQQHLAGSLSLSYREPILAARGHGQYLYDYRGKRYLDAVNNVPHVGHCHPRIVAAAHEAATVLSTNTRYLYPEITDYADALRSTVDDSLSVVFLVNSGSEANDLALRLARNYTGRNEVLALDHGYHGNLGTLIDISAYKHDGPGGQGAPGWVHKAALPDAFRGKYRNDKLDDEELCGLYVGDVQQQLATTSNIACFIAESISGCGGQLVYPQGYLQAAYSLIREYGGVCIADEVQTGFGRIGSHFWAYEAQNVTPDIVTFGKPAGNGHPLAGVITSRKIAQAFDNGMEYFNTFGGNPVSCRIGYEVLQVLREQELQKNALHTGNYLKQGLEDLAGKYHLIGEVRGAGLFLGVELVTDRFTRSPAASQASYVAERMKQEGVLISTDGPDHNVLKIKPPMVFDRSDADFLLKIIEGVLAETWSQSG